MISIVGNNLRTQPLTISRTGNWLVHLLAAGFPA